MPLTHHDSQIYSRLLSLCINPIRLLKSLSNYNIMQRSNYT